MTPADRIRAALTDPATPRRSRNGWVSLLDLQTRTGLAAREVDRALAELVDDIEWTYSRPVRVRLLPTTARQLTIGGDTA